jgi:hypothetical protein
LKILSLIVFMNVVLNIEGRFAASVC